MFCKKNNTCIIILLCLMLATVISCKKTPEEDKPKPKPDDGSITGTISEPTIFSKVSSDPNVADYYITGALNLESELTIEPGVVIEMGAGASIVVKTSGTLIAIGEDTNPITITGLTKSRGSWKYIMINSNDPRNELNYVNIEYGGGDDSNNGTIYMNTGAYLNLQNTRISNSKNNALVAATEDAVLSNFISNVFEYNEYVMQIRPNQIPQLNDNNTYTNNDNNYITLIGSYIKAPLIWNAKSIPYKHKGTTVIEADVTINEGVNIRMDFSSMIKVSPTGSLNINGTSANRVIFSSVEDVQGYWHCILYQSRSNNNMMSYVDVSYGGGSPDYMGTVYIGTSLSYPDAFLKMSNCNISLSASWGVYVQSNADYTNNGGNVFSNNIMGNIGP